MADLASSDVTITLEERYARGGTKRKVFRVKLAFGDGLLTYPAAGVPLPSYARFGLVQRLDYLVLFDANDGVGLLWKYDRENKKLRAWQSGGLTPAGTIAAPVFTGAALTAHRHVLHFQTSAAANAVTAAANNLRTAAAAFDVAGVADSAGEGGVVDVTGGTPAGTNSAPAFTGTAVAAGALVELGNVAVAAQILYAEAVGW